MVLKSVLVLSSLFFSQFAGATTFDTAKFRAKAATQLSTLVGAGNIVGQGAVYFRDGAGATDDPPLYDYGSYLYVVKVKPGVLPAGVSLAYRLNLSGSEDAVTVSMSEKEPLIVSIPGEGVATLKPNAKAKSVEKLMIGLKQVSPNGSFSYLDAINMISFAVGATESVPVHKMLLASPLVAGVELSYEMYRQPFAFDLVQTVSDQRKIDADKYRGVTAKFKIEGLPFATETTVPADLQ